MTDSDPYFEDINNQKTPFADEDFQGRESDKKGAPKNYRPPAELFFDYMQDSGDSGKSDDVSSSCPKTTDHRHDESSDVLWNKSSVNNTNGPAKRHTEIQYAALKPTTLGFENEKKLGHKVYRLRGYTTIGKVNRKYQMERQQRFLRNLLTVLLIIILIVILAVIYNPIKDMAEMRKILGDDGYFAKHTRPVAQQTGQTSEMVKPSESSSSTPSTS